MALPKCIEHEFSRIFLAGRPDLPEIVRHHLIEIVPRGSEFRPVEYGLPRGEILRDML